MAIKFAKDPRFANRGRDFEELIELSNRQYAHQGLAMVHKVPTAWKPIRSLPRARGTGGGSFGASTRSRVTPTRARNGQCYITEGAFDASHSHAREERAYHPVEVTVQEVTRDD